MSSLRSKVIRLAYENPVLRGHLLPLVKEARSIPTETIVGGRSVEFVGNGTRVVIPYRMDGGDPHVGQDPVLTDLVHKAIQGSGTLVLTTRDWEALLDPSRGRRF